MSSQDDLGMLWYGVSGVSFNPTDPSEVMLNTGITAPLLSDHPRALVAPQVSQTSLGPHPHQANITYGDQLVHHSQMLYDPQTGDFVNPSDYMYEPYEGYEDDSSNANGLNAQGQQILMNQQQNHTEEENGSHPKSKKPKVHQNPALKLKTPIAYQKDTDLNAIPIMKEGMAVCEKCGAIGVKHAFYGKERKYCSLACARPPMQNMGSLKGPSDLPRMAQKLDNNQFDVKKETANGTNEPNLYTGNGTCSIPSSVTFNNCLEESSNSSASMDSKEASNPSTNAAYEFDNQNASDESLHQMSNNLIDSPSPKFSSTNSWPPGQETASKESPNADASPSSPSARATPTYLPPPVTKESLGQSFEWEQTYFSAEDFQAAAVQSFKHAPMSECWEQVSPGMKVEVSCGEESLMKDAFWVATVTTICGYKAKLRFEGFVTDESKDFWVDLCSEEVHPVGWCATQGKPLIPPKSIQNKYKDWKDFLMKRLTGARTLPTNFHAKVVESLKSRFRPGLNLEVVDKNRIAQMRVATVTKVIGKRLHLRYHGAPPDDNGFWCHEDAPIIHPVGWSREVGHEIVASQSYHEKCVEVAYDPDDATSDLFASMNRPPVSKTSRDHGFVEGMKLEAIDPLNLATICVATVMKILSYSYLMIRIDSYDNDNTCSDWFCYHSSSTSIFPAGFCEMNGILLTPPRGYEGQFSWFNYLTTTQAIAAPPALFSREVPEHGFKLGMSLEAADLMDPRLVCVAAVKEVKGRLLKIHFDGWENDFDQWVDCQSPDIYPIGWCSLVGYKLEGPRVAVPVQMMQRKKIRGRPGRKGRSFGGTRRGAVTGRGIENSSPLPNSIPMFPSIPNKRGRKPRLRGNFSQHLRENHSTGDDNFSGDQDFSNDISCNVNEMGFATSRARRGRPRKNRFRGNNDIALQSQRARPMRTTRTIPSYVNSEDDASDETSSGVASLAGSENSSDAWDMDQYNIDPMQEGQISNNDDFDQSMHNMETESFMDELTPLTTDSGYRDSTRPTLNLKAISDESVLFSDEGPTLDSFLATADERLVDSLPLSDSSSDFRVTSSFDVNSIMPSANCNTNTTTVSSSLTSSQLGVPPSPQSLSEEHFMEAVSAIPDAGLLSGLSTVPSQDSFQSNHFIPKIIDSSSVLRGEKIQPKLWSHHDVATFLTVNDCGAYCNNFIVQKIDGSRLLKLAQNEVMELTGMKVGPSLKIHDLIQQLLAIVNPAQARYQATLLKRGLAFGKA